MATVNILGQAGVINSTIKLEHLKLISKFHPEKLVVKDAESKAELFRISIAKSGLGSISKYGIEFAPASTSDYAQVTLAPITKETLIDKYGGVILALNKFESSINPTIESTLAEINKIKDSIIIG